MYAAVDMILSACFDAFATPAIFLLSYNAVAPKMFGFMRIDYWTAFIFIWGARAVWLPPMIEQAIRRQAVNRIEAAVRDGQEAPV